MYVVGSMCILTLCGRLALAKLVLFDMIILFDTSFGLPSDVTYLTAAAPSTAPDNC